MIERLQQDSDKSLEQHQQDVLVALDTTAKEASGGQPEPAVDNHFVSKTMTSAVGGSIFVTSAANNSIFIGGRGGKAAYTRTPLVPMSYAEKKEVATSALKNQGKSGNDIFARSQIAGQSLTGGGTSSGGKNTPARGFSVTAKTAKTLQAAQDLLKEMAVVNKTLNKPYDNAPKRLANDLLKGKNNATATARNINPQALPVFGPG